jgi:hypothetical protein
MYEQQTPLVTFAINNGGYTRENFEISFHLCFNVGGVSGGRWGVEWLMPCYITTLYLNVTIPVLSRDCCSVRIFISSLVVSH